MTLVPLGSLRRRRSNSNNKRDSTVCSDQRPTHRMTTRRERSLRRALRGRSKRSTAIDNPDDQNNAAHRIESPTMLTQLVRAMYKGLVKSPFATQLVQAMYDGLVKSPYESWPIYAIDVFSMFAVVCDATVDSVVAIDFLRHGPVDAFLARVW